MAVVTGQYRTPLLLAFAAVLVLLPPVVAAKGKKAKPPPPEPVTMVFDLHGKRAPSDQHPDSYLLHASMPCHIGERLLYNAIGG